MFSVPVAFNGQGGGPELAPAVGRVGAGGGRKRCVGRLIQTCCSNFRWYIQVAIVGMKRPVAARKSCPCTLQHKQQQSQG
jgi:hypothetical protein